MTPTVEVRDSETAPWRPAPWLDPHSVESTNKAYYGWQKFRLAPTESEQAA